MTKKRLKRGQTDPKLYRAIQTIKVAKSPGRHFLVVIHGSFER